MRTNWLPASLLLLLCLLLIGCGSQGAQGAPRGDEAGPDTSDPPSDEAAVRSIVEAFGKELQHVSLLAGEDEIRDSMTEHYGPYVTEELLAVWIAEPSNAPGRAVSSPWPDRIEIDSIERLPGDANENAYKVEGRIIEITSVEVGTDEAAAVRPITLVVKKYDDNWLIDEVTLGDYEPVDGDHNGDQPEGVSYINRSYGFRVALPENWQGYSVVHEEWEGRALDDNPDANIGAGDIVERGPVLRIRHPEWTEKRPRQDIPIMVFTLEQWESLQQAKFSVGAAPVGPTELGRNDSYVFALPARYNYEFPEGYEEVEQILANDPLEPLAPGEGKGAMGAAAVLAAASRPAHPTSYLLEKDSGELVDWLTGVEHWLHTVVLIPNALAEMDKPADAGARETAKEALTNFFTDHFAEDVLQFYWIAEDGKPTYRLLPTEGPAVLPFVDEVELIQVDRSQIVVRASSPSSVLWEDLTRTYRLHWSAADGNTFRIAEIDTEGW